MEGGRGERVSQSEYFNWSADLTVVDLTTEEDNCVEDQHYLNMLPPVGRVRGKRHNLDRDVQNLIGMFIEVEKDLEKGKVMWWKGYDYNLRKQNAEWMEDT